MRHKTGWSDVAYCTVRCARLSQAGIVELVGRVLGIWGPLARAEAIRVPTAIAELDAPPCLLRIIGDLPCGSFQEPARA